MTMGLGLLAFLIPVVFLTSALSGIFGMAGGIILMLVLLVLMPLPMAMVIHAVIQTASNGWRCWLWRRHIVWGVLPYYILGVTLGFLVVIFVSYVPDKAWALIAMGSLPLLTMLLRRYLTLTIMNRYHACGAAIILTFIQMTGGVVGPLLDTLYNQTALTRQQIISTKAFTQVFMHVLRFTYYSFVVSAMGAAEFASLEILNALAWPLMVLVVVSVAGTSAAAVLVKRWNDTHFKQASSYLIMAISMLCLAQGFYLILTR